jgi:hypothetical protein
MKFYSYTNDNENYTKAISLSNVRSITRDIGNGRSAIRFGVSLTYCDGSHQSLPWLGEEESKKIYKEIVDLLNKRG